MEHPSIHDITADSVQESYDAMMDLWSQRDAFGERPEIEYGLFDELPLEELSRRIHLLIEWFGFFAQRGKPETSLMDTPRAREVEKLISAFRKTA